MRNEFLLDKQVYFQAHRDEIIQLPFAWNWRGTNISGGIPATEAMVEHFAGCGISRDPTSCPDHERPHVPLSREAALVAEQATALPMPVSKS